MLYISIFDTIGHVTNLLDISMLSRYVWDTSFEMLLDIYGLHVTQHSPPVTGCHTDTGRREGGTAPPTYPV